MSIALATVSVANSSPIVDSPLLLNVKKHTIFIINHKVKIVTQIHVLVFIYESFTTVIIIHFKVTELYLKTPGCIIQRQYTL